MNQVRISIAAWSTLALGACSSAPASEGNESMEAVEVPQGSDSAANIGIPGAAGAPAAQVDGNEPNSAGGAPVNVNPLVPAGTANPLPTAESSNQPASGGRGNESTAGGGSTANPEPTPSAGNGTAGAAGAAAGGTPGSSGAPGAAGSVEGGAGMGAAGGGSVDQGGERLDGVSENFSFFVTSYFHIRELSGSDDGFGGNLSYGGKVGIEGADAICQEMASRVGFNNRTWRAYLSTSTVDAKDRIGTGPWYDFVGNLVAENVEGLLVAKSQEEGGGFMGGGEGGLMGGTCAGEDNELDRPLGGALDCGTYDELGLYHDGTTDQDNDGVNDDDHDTMTATLADGTYAGFSCEDWTSTTATIPAEFQQGGGEPPGGGGFIMGGILMGHSWPAGSGMHWAEAHGGHACAAGTNFIQDGPGDSATVGGGGGYGGFYCFALAE